MPRKAGRTWALEGIYGITEVQTQPDYVNFLHDERCWGVDCGNKAAVAFHSWPGRMGREALSFLCEVQSRERVVPLLRVLEVTL